MLTDPAMSAFAVAATVLALQMVALALWTGTVRTRRKVFSNPEDARLTKTELAEREHEDVRRVQRAHQNALENAVPFFAIGLLYAATGPSQVGALGYFVTFVAARGLHSVFYLAGKQPFRTLSFAVGVLCLIGMAVHVLRFVA
ncbi:MAG: MAPEG family protein [Myxococcales bacterium]|nr:MAPEG family protein [Myxococcales bacterium]